MTQMIEEDLFFPGKPIDDVSTLGEGIASSDANDGLVSNGMPTIDEQQAVISYPDSGRSLSDTSHYSFLNADIRE